MLLGKKTYLLPETGNLYKANLHCHSTVSDGKFSPEELKKMYMERGYHAIAYTDHQVCVPHPELTDENFVALTGLEIAFGIKKATSVHICGIARNPTAELKIPNEIMDDIEKINAGIKRLNESDYITTLNHPRWSGMSAVARRPPSRVGAWSVSLPKSTPLPLGRGFMNRSSARELSSAYPSAQFYAAKEACPYPSTLLSRLRL